MASVRHRVARPHHDRAARRAGNAVMGGKSGA